MTAKKTKGPGFESAATKGNAAEMMAFIAQWVKLPRALAFGAYRGREDFAQVDPDDGALGEGEESR